MIINRTKEIHKRMCPTFHQPNSLHTDKVTIKSDKKTKHEYTIEKKIINYSFMTEWCDRRSIEPCKKKKQFALIAIEDYCALLCSLKSSQGNMKWPQNYMYMLIRTVCCYVETQRMID